MTYASWGARAITRAPQEACPRLGAMSGCSHRFRPRGLCRGAALTLVFGCVLATGAATGSLPQDPDPLPELPARTVASSHAPVDRAEIEDAAARAEADGKSVKEAAGEVVSRSGDRWGAVYDEREYEEFEQALDGSYLGVGLSARRTEGGGVAVSRVQPGGPPTGPGSARVTCSARSTAAAWTAGPSPRWSRYCAETVRGPGKGPASSSVSYGTENPPPRS